MSNERPPAEKVISAKGAKNKLRKDKSGQRKIKAAESAGTQAPPTHTTLQVSKDPKARTVFFHSGSRMRMPHTNRTTLDATSESRNQQALTVFHKQKSMRGAS